MTNYEIYNVDDVTMKHEEGGDTVDANRDTLSGIKDDIKLEASGAMNGAILKTKRGINSEVCHEDISANDREVCMTNNGIYPFTTNIYNVESILTKHERGIYTEDTLENILSENKDSIKPKVPEAALSSVPMIEISKSTITNIDQTKKQEKGNEFGARMKDTDHMMSKDCIEKTWGGIHAPVENSI